MHATINSAALPPGMTPRRAECLLLEEGAAWSILCRSERRELDRRYRRLFSLLRRACGFSFTEALNALQSHKLGDGWGSEALNVAGGSAAAIGRAFAFRRLYRERIR